MNVEIGTKTPICLFWEYLFRNSGVLSLQCVKQQIKKLAELLINTLEQQMKKLAELLMNTLE
jgi:hypothetical protein